MIIKKFKTILLLLFYCNFCSSSAYAADLFDFRVFPDYERGVLKFAGTVADSDVDEDGTRRRTRASGLVSSWLASGVFLIENDQGIRFRAVIADGDFSGELPAENFASTSLQVYVEKDVIWTERVCFPQKIDFIVISDIDDTILVTEVTSKRRLLYNSLLKTIDERLPVKGTAELYQALKENSTLGRPHFVYLSSSPSYFSRFLKAFIEKHGFPSGTIILKKGLRSGDHDQHKSGWLRRVAAMYPEKPLVLIGDSGELDPVIYSGFVEKSKLAKNVKQIIIHEVTNSEEKIKELEQIKQKVEKNGSTEFHFWSSIESLKESLKGKLLRVD